MIDYYEILGINETATKDCIKLSFRKLSLQYHPDKNKDNNSKDKFILIREAYEILIDDNRRKIYDYQRRFSFLKHFDLNEYEINYLNSLYEKINNSYEIRFCKILFNTMPGDMKETFNELKKKFFPNNNPNNNSNDNSNDNSQNNLNKEIIIPPKYIDIIDLKEDYTLNLNIDISDVYNIILKRIIIHTKDYICYLFLRTFDDIIIINGKYSFKLKFHVKSDKFIKRNNDLVFIKNINIYQLLFQKKYDIILPDNSNLTFTKNDKNIYLFKNKGLLNSYDYKSRGNMYVIFNLDYSKDYSEYETEIKEIFN